MRFELKLQGATRPEWKAYYIDYTKLKQLLREKDTLSGSALRRSIAEGANGTTANGSTAPDKWTEDDEKAFRKELLDTQLEKVNNFQVEMSKQLSERCDSCEKELIKLHDDVQNNRIDNTTKQARLKENLETLDGIARDLNELERFTRINYTGFVKAAKKHDRKRGASSAASGPKVGQLLQEKAERLNVNSVDYSPLLRR